MCVINSHENMNNCWLQKWPENSQNWNVFTPCMVKTSISEFLRHFIVLWWVVLLREPDVIIEAVQAFGKLRPHSGSLRCCIYYLWLFTTNFSKDVIYVDIYFNPVCFQEIFSVQAVDKPRSLYLKLRVEVEQSWVHCITHSAQYAVPEQSDLSVLWYTNAKYCSGHKVKAMWPRMLVWQFFYNRAYNTKCGFRQVMLNYVTISETRCFQQQSF